MPPEFKRLQHLALKVRNIQKSLKFYCDVLGFKTTEGYRFDKEKGYQNSINFITCSNKHHVINLVQISESHKPNDIEPPSNSRDTHAYGLHHFAFEVKNKIEFKKWEKHLLENKIKIVKGPLVHSPTHPEGDGSWGENRALYFCDPDGNAIEIFCDMANINFATHEIEDLWFRQRIKKDGFDPHKISKPNLNI
tara:strand:+ start:60 stop:638 length:579 start_codon:yes stop_codon:yes gene_type:complete